MPKTYATCPECGLRFELEHHRKLFCTPAHSKAYSNRQLSEGQRIVALAKAWRASKDTRDPDLKEAGKRAFSMMCRELDEINREDRAAARMPALKLFWVRLSRGLLDHQGVLNRPLRPARPGAGSS